MTDTAPHGSIRRTASHRADLLVFEVVKRIPSDDMDWMATQVETAFAAFEEVDMLIVMRDFQGADASSALDPAVMRVQLKSLAKVRRYAVVGAPSWARTMIEAMDTVIPVDAKTFDLEEEAEARAWVGERPTSGARR